VTAGGAREELPEASHTGEVADTPGRRPVSDSEVVFSGRIFDVARDRVDLGDAGEVDREYLRHPGAVGIVALDADDRVLLVRQYRHPVGAQLWEVPAGLLDVAGEPALETARRELAEEADLRAGRWDVLVDLFTTPGGSDEALRLYLARDLSAVPEHELHEREDEELGMATAWVPLDDAQRAVLSGRLSNPSTVAGVLAAWVARAQGWEPLRPADSAWPARPPSGPPG
jgi:8-oxo-dGDP phosphatase